MNKANKKIILGLVALAVIFILVYANTDLFVPAEGEVVETVEDVVTDEPELSEAVDGSDDAVGADFSPDEDPFSLYERARAEGKPIVIEYYARH